MNKNISIFLEQQSVLNDSPIESYRKHESLDNYGMVFLKIKDININFEYCRLVIIVIHGDVLTIREPSGGVLMPRKFRENLERLTEIFPGTVTTITN